MSVIFNGDIIMKKRAYIIPIVIISSLTIIIYLFWGHIGVSLSGFRYVFDNQKYNHSYDKLTDNLEFQILLSDLDKNTGKTIFNQDGCVVKISEVRSYENDNYIVFFETCGTYGYKTSKLISGIKYTNNMSTEFTAKLEIKSDDKYYKCSLQGCSPMSMKTGDAFAFYMFNIDSNKALVAKDNRVTLSLSGLTINQWVKK